MTAAVLIAAAIVVGGASSILTVKAATNPCTACVNNGPGRSEVVAIGAQQGQFGSTVVAPGAHELGGLSCNAVTANNGVGCGPSLPP